MQNDIKSGLCRNKCVLHSAALAFSLQ